MVTRRAGSIQLLALTVAVIGLMLAALSCQSDAPSLPGETDRPAVMPLPPQSVPTADGPSDTSLQPTTSVVYVPPTPGPAPEVTDADIDNLADLIAETVQPRPVTADEVWVYLMLERNISANIALEQIPPAGGSPSPPEETLARMLELWRSDSPCFGMLEAEIAALGDNNLLGAVRYVQYLDYVTTQIAPCLDEQLPLLEADQFFKNSSEVRADRITRWFDQSWPIQTGPTVSDTASCREDFYSHVPAAVAATQPSQLSAELDSAQSEVFECLASTVSDEYRLMDLDADQLFDLPPEQRRRLITLQATFIGHVSVVGFGKEYAECWPEFEAQLPAVAMAASPEDLIDREGAAVNALHECVIELPPDNPFGRQ